MSEWMVVSRDRIVILPSKTQIAHLAVAAQAEHLISVLPPAPYLDYLDALPARHGITPERNKTVFFTRAKLRPAGRHAGEAYLASALAEVGVQVVSPEKLTLERQMELFLGGAHLIFTEGSAVHCRQLMGRLPQAVTVLCRRNTMPLSQLGLQARCPEVSFANVTRNIFVLERPDGRSVASGGLSFFDTDGLLETADELGLPLRQVWSNAAFRESELEDLHGWIDTSIGWGLCISPDILRNVAHQSGFADQTDALFRTAGDSLRRFAPRRDGMGDDPAAFDPPGRAQARQA